MLHATMLRSLSSVRRNAFVMPKRTLIASPPLVRMNVYKKIAIGGSACLSFFIIPAYIIANMKYYNKSAYKKEEEEEEE